ncbi:hypothetical protein FN846DRAFT_174347 [Sphaerosporella brunnea]|uniref:Methyltransferase domain-containing protein n=1 Tax=Sphaerosporella brunnea TaxID=1250544 RepID=A0A5J5EQJ9_9PEZI|nr:hypothetical protein FN846DRAFT_174347 [Sphaerosporella brunnea]
MTEHGVVNKLLEAHIKRLQDKAWEIFPYPCIGLFEFVKFNLPTYPAYAHVLSLLQRDHGAVYLDVGCCVGQDLRYLRSHERIPPSQLVGAELQQEFIDLGHELFLDSPEETGIRMQAADIFDAHSWLEKEMRGKCAVVHASYFLHLFNYARQREAAERLVGYLRGRPGDVIVGRMIGSAVAGEYMHPTVGVMMRHDLASFGKFWDEVGSRTGRKLKVECQIDPNTVRVSPEGKRFDHPPEEKATEMVFSITCE